MNTWYRASFVIQDDQVTPHGGILVKEGQIVGHTARGERPDEPYQEVDLGEVAIVAGQINVHSHAFQRALRGKTERLRGVEETFWGWREGMYDLALRIDADEMEAIAAMAFLEMLRGGIIEVGEFHYLHHDRNGQAYDDKAELAHRVVRAARSVGLPITLLPVAYHCGGIGEPPTGEQRRFLFSNLKEYLGFVEQLESDYKEDSAVKVGLAPHSIRAASREWIEGISEFADRHEMVVHIHSSEQRREVAESINAYGLTPVEALHHWGVLRPEWTLIHGTHLSLRDLEILGELKPTIGACPTTERNLGDGFLPARQLLERQVPIALGSDSHTIINPFEELRLVEYHERLRYEGRNLLAHRSSHSSSLETARVLWDMGTTNGARSLGSTPRDLSIGSPADFITVDLKDLSLAGSTEETLLANIVFSMNLSALSDVVIGGEVVVRQGVHPQEEAIVARFQEVMDRYQ